MLKFVFGRSGTGKTEYVFNEIKALAENGEKNILLLTPEQYSLVAERRLLDDLGEKNIGVVDNFSFSRISDDVKAKYGDSSLPTLSKGGKVVLMSQAVEKCKNDFLLFNKNLDSLFFVNSVISIYDEMKSCNLTYSQINELSEGIESDALKRKLHDISLIIAAYEASIENRYYDSANELTRIYKLICDKNYFKDRYVFIDGFNGFVAQEYKILELIIGEAKCVTVTLCADGVDEYDQNGLFAYVNKSAQIINKIALKADVDVNIVKLSENHRFKNRELSTAEINFSGQKEPSLTKNEFVNVYASKNITDECEYVAREIKGLLRNGYKASDITVITRSLSFYKSDIEAEFRKYEVPYFKDEREAINTQPLVVMIEFLLRCVNYSLKSDDILSLAKTGMTSISDEEINSLENYIFLWNINGAQWKREFENSTKGFVENITQSDKAALDAVNKTREKLISPILAFKNAAKSKNAREICEALYNTIIAFGADKKIREYAIKLNENGFYALASEQKKIWKLVMEAINQMAVILDEIDLKSFAKLFSMIIKTEDLGSLPAGIDNVQLGQADRIRVDNPKAVFVIGANEGEFPRLINGMGLLSEADRRVMLDNDFKLYSYGEIMNLQERYFAYMSVAAPSERLYVSYLSSGKDCAPSEIITDITANYSEFRELNMNDFKEIDLIDTRANAFELMSSNYFNTSPFYASLKEYFKNSNKFEAVKALAENDEIKIKDKKLATELFGKNMLISASRVEDFYNCPFRYFCKYGLSAKKRNPAQIDPMQRGTLIHYILENILSEIGTKRLSELDEAEIKALVDKYSEQYFVNQMGNLTNASKRFKYNYKRLSNLVYDVVIHLSQEFKNCDFEAKAFEMSIDSDGEVKPEIIPLKDGGTVQIRGSIDRVDVFEKNGKKYVRVVDYKSGAKKFKLQDILAGLNLQMFIYLFSLCEDKAAALSGIPAGVLYMHASSDVVDFSSFSDAQSSLKKEKSEIFKMNGLILSDDENAVAEAMEHELKGKYIPVKLKSNGELKGSLANLEQLGYIHNKVNELLAQMGILLQDGNVARLPVKNSSHKNTCEYCDYASVCANTKIIFNRETENLNDEEVLEKLGKENVQNDRVD